MCQGIRHRRDHSRPRDVHVGHDSEKAEPRGRLGGAPKDAHRVSHHAS